MKDKLNAVNYIRILCTFWVLFFHDNIHYGFVTGITILDEFISIGAVAVTGFFMLSGFSLRYHYKEAQLIKREEYAKYIKRRLTGVYPVYIFLLLAAILLRYRIGGGGVQFIQILPIQMSLLQVLLYPSLNIYLFNDNCWYLSALFVLYLLFPFLNELIKGFRTKQKVILCIGMTLLSWYIYYLNMMPDNPNVYLSYYCNPLFRIPEFVVGMLTADLVVECKKDINGKILMMLGGIATVFALSGCHLLYSKWQTAYNLYNIIIIPYFTILLFAAGKSRGILSTIASWKWMQYITDMGLTIYLCQSLAFVTFERIPIKADPRIAFIILTIVYAFLVHEIIERPCKRILRKKIGA